MYIHNVKLTYNHLNTGVAAPLSLTAESGDVATNTASDSVAMGTVATETSESDSYFDHLASSARPRPRRRSGAVASCRRLGYFASRAKTAGDDGVARVESFSSPRWMGIKPVPDGGPPPLPERKGRVAPPPVPLGGTLFGASMDGRGGPPPIPTLLGFGASSLGGPPPPQAPLSEIRDGYIAGDLQATCSVCPPPPPPPAQLCGPPPRPPKVGYGAALLPCGSPPPPPLSPLSGLPPPSPPVPLSGPPPLAFGFGAALPPGGPPPPPRKVRYGAVLPLSGPPPPSPPAPLSGPPPPPRLWSRQSITAKVGMARGMLGLPLSGLPPPSPPVPLSGPPPLAFGFGAALPPGGPPPPPRKVRYGAVLPLSGPPPPSPPAPLSGPPPPPRLWSRQSITAKVGMARGMLGLPPPPSKPSEATEPQPPSEKKKKAKAVGLQPQAAPCPRRSLGDRGGTASVTVDEKKKEERVAHMHGSPRGGGGGGGGRGSLLSSIKSGVNLKVCKDFVYTKNIATHTVVYYLPEL